MVYATIERKITETLKTVILDDEWKVLIKVKHGRRLNMDDIPIYDALFLKIRFAVDVLGLPSDFPCESNEVAKRVLQFYVDYGV